MTTSALIIRIAHDTDAAVLDRLAQLDSQRPLTGDVLLAESAGRPVAALALADRRTTADPFLPSAGAVELLCARARQLAATAGLVRAADRARLRARAGRRGPVRGWRSA